MYDIAEYICNRLPFQWHVHISSYSSNYILLPKGKSSVMLLIWQSWVREKYMYLFHGNILMQFHPIKEGFTIPVKTTNKVGKFFHFSTLDFSLPKEYY